MKIEIKEIKDNDKSSASSNFLASEIPPEITPAA